MYSEHILFVLRACNGKPFDSDAQAETNGTSLSDRLRHAWVNPPSPKMAGFHAKPPVLAPGPRLVSFCLFALDECEDGSSSNPSLSLGVEE